MKQVLDKSGIREKLLELGLPEGKSHNRIPALDVIEAFWVSVWIGASKFSHTAVVRLDATLKIVFGWKRVASGTTFTRYFRRFTQPINTSVFSELNTWFFNQLRFDNYTLDVDSSVLTRFGEQEGSCKGYNPKKRGRASHHPLFAFVSELRMVANCWLRSGDTSSSNNCISFMNETFGILGGKKIGLFRADSGFCGESVFSFLEEKKVPYVIAGRLHGVLQGKIRDVSSWNVIDKGLWISEFTYRAQSWSQERRFIVIRQSIALRPRATGKQLKLFDDSIYYRNYRFHCIYTNQHLPALQIWQQYKGRADAENRIQELRTKAMV